MSEVYDCFMFYNELDLLEIRLNEMDSEVDKFVIVEAELTHQRTPKPMFFAENKQKYEKFLDKIIHIVVPASVFNDDSWHNDNIQRTYMLKGIEEAKDDDFIIMSDCDEIVSQKTLNHVKNNFVHDAYIFNQNFYLWYLNTRAKGMIWHNAGIAKKKKIQEIGTLYFKNNKTCLLLPRVDNGGWHFSYIGSPENCKTKLNSFGHREFAHLSIEELKYNRDNLLDPLGRKDEGIDIITDPIEMMPNYVQQNVEKFKHLIR